MGQDILHAAQLKVLVAAVQVLPGSACAARDCSVLRLDYICKHVGWRRLRHCVIPWPHHPSWLLGAVAAVGPQEPAFQPCHGVIGASFGVWEVLAGHLVRMHAWEACPRREAQAGYCAVHAACQGVTGEANGRHPTSKCPKGSSYVHKLLGEIGIALISWPKIPEAS